MKSHLIFFKRIEQFWTKFFNLNVIVNIYTTKIAHMFRLTYVKHLLLSMFLTCVYFQTFVKHVVKNRCRAYIKHTVCCNFSSVGDKSIKQNKLCNKEQWHCMTQYESVYFINLYICYQLENKLKHKVLLSIT